MSDDKPKGLGILGVKAALELVFKGCTVDVPKTMAGSHHATVSFYEYEIRVILSGKRAPGRPIHFRFMQRAKGKGDKVTKFVLNEVRTTDPAVLQAAILDAKAHLLGIVYAIRSAFSEKTVPRINSIEDLFTEE